MYLKKNSFLVPVVPGSEELSGDEEGGTPPRPANTNSVTRNSRTNNALLPKPKLKRPRILNKPRSTFSKMSATGASRF